MNKKAQKEKFYRIPGILCSVFILLKLTSIGLAEERKAVEFENDIIPIFTKMGCNAGKCHGAAIGRGDFKLSLYGGDPKSDFEEIVRRVNGRRVNLSKPAESLVVLKPTANLKHGGRMLFDNGSESERLLIDWIKQGAKNVKYRQLKYVKVTPQRLVVSKTGDMAQLKAIAHYDDGQTQDVTDWTSFVAEDPSAVDIDEDAATAEVRRGGRHIVVARYLSAVIPIVLVSPLNNQVVDLSSGTRNNFVDEYVLRLLAELGLPTSPLADDGRFLRRLTLDLTGRLPEYNHESRVSGLDREAIIDKLLSSEEFVHF